MNRLIFLLKNIHIGLQIILWLLCFYWLDFELYTYIVNDNLIMKTLLGVMLLSCQLFFFENLYYLIIIDSVFEKEPNQNVELQNINENLNCTTCKKCNILRPKRTHHCRYCNKCIIRMDHHCFSLNKCIGKRNYLFFLKYLVTLEINISLIFWITLYVCINYYYEIEFITLIKYGVLIFASFIGSIGIFFYLIFHLYLFLKKITTLELFYPSLRKVQ